MYRMLMARSGYYYVQKKVGYSWFKVGGFFNTRAGAKRFISDHRSLSYVPPIDRGYNVLGYY